MDGCVKRLYSIIDNIRDQAPDKIPMLLEVLNREREYKMKVMIQHSQSDMCECGNIMSIYSDTSEYKCSGCGLTSIIHGAIFDDIQLYNQDGQKPKHGRHYPSLHCRLWISRIQAWTGPEISPDVFDKLLICIRRDSINTKKIRCRQIRKYLKECGYSTYNNFVPYIRKRLTGITPPQLTEVELNNLFNLFNKVAAVLKRNRPKNNITYYPYIIYKVLDSILITGIRKARILECIHLQSNNTMRFIDDIYGEACAEIDELDNKPTNKYEYEFYL